MEVLQQFALSEAPKLWQTVQDLKVEQTQRRAGIQRLDRELRDFGRSPETDLDFQNLVREADELDRIVDAILLKVEDAYIAQQKFRATPSRRDYEALMKSALENGIQAADAATSRFQRNTGACDISPTFHVREQNPSGCWGFAHRSSLHSRFRRVGSFA